MSLERKALDSVILQRMLAEYQELRNSAGIDLFPPASLSMVVVVYSMKFCR
jgi:hypothetical protein